MFDNTLINLVIITYLLVTFALGILSSRGILTYKSYILGKGNYPFWLISITAVATLIGGARTIGDIMKVYEIGVIYVIANSFNIVNHLITAKFIVPKVYQFQNVCSISDIMGVIYGKSVRCISALFSILLCLGIIGMQILALSILLKDLLGSSYLETLIYSMLLIVFYSALGGLHAVIITDIFQLIVIVIVIPLMVFMSIYTTDGISIMQEFNKDILTNNSINYAFLAMQFAFPIINPALIQRILISKKEDAIKTVYLLAFTDFILIVLGTSMGFALRKLYPQLPADVAFNNLIKLHFPIWMQALVIIGFLSVIMSTTDSFLNKTSVLFIHDFVSQFIKLNEKLKLRLTQLFTLFAGILALVITLNFKAIIDMRVYFLSFYIVTVMIPFIFGLIYRKIDKGFYFASVGMGLLFIIMNSIWIKFNLIYVGNIICIIVSAIPFIIYFWGKRIIESIHIYQVCRKKLSKNIITGKLKSYIKPIKHASKNKASIV